MRAQAEGRTHRPDIISAEQIKKGMKGYGLTVFEGTKPTRFDVEVIDVLRDFRPRQELILVKTKHPRLEVAKIVGGMSGSPIYFNGKMAGAYAYGWTFGVEPVAGVTPIRSMLDDLERPLPKMIHGLPLGMAPAQNSSRRANAGGGQGRSASVLPALAQGRFAGALEDYSPTSHAEQIAARSPFRQATTRGQRHFADPQLVPVSTPLLLGGLTNEAAQVAERLLSPLGLMPLQAGGTGSNPTGKKEGFVDGGALGVNLVSGDVSAMGLGTVTRVEGNRLVGFGHPMMQIGVTSLPTTEARILWFMASQMRSFKMGEATHSSGALVNDRQASVVVDQALDAPTVAVSLRILGEAGAPFTDWNFKVAHDRFLTPSLLGVALGNGLSSTAAERRDVTWSMTTRLKFEGYPEIEIVDLGSTPAGTPAASQVMQSDALKAVGQVFNNPWQYARLLGVDVEVKLRFAREVARLRGIQLLSPEVQPGQPARVRILLEPYDGRPTSQVVSIPIPRKFAGQTVRLKVRPGYMVPRVRAAPESLADLISNLEAGTMQPRSLVFSSESGEGAAAYQGIVAQHLPPGVMDRLASSSTTKAPAHLKTMRHHVVPTSLFVTGTDTVSVEVRPEKP